MIETFTDQGSEYFFANTPAEDQELRSLATSLKVPIVDDDVHEYHELCFTSHGHIPLGTWKPYACLVVNEGRPEVAAIRARAVQI